MEEPSAFRNQVCSEEHKKDNHNKDKTKPVQDKSFKKSSQQSKYQHYMSLNVIRVHLLEEAFNAKILSLLALTRLVNSADRKKTCWYH